MSAAVSIPASRDTVLLAMRLRAARIRLARVDGAAFCEYVLRNEADGQPIECTPDQVEWHRLAERHRRLIVWSHVEAGKTQQLSIGRVLFRLGQNPNLRVLIVANTHHQAEKITRTIQNYIEHSPELREVFPHLRPGTPWGSAKFNVVRKVWSKDFSVQATGARGKIVGGRFDMVVIDDILDIENTESVEQRKRLERWFLSSIVGRLTERCEVLAPGNAYHPLDLLHHLRDVSGYTWRTYPIANDKGEPRFPQNWSLARIAEKRRELGPVEAARQLDCVSRDETTQRCKQEWIDACLERGLDVGMPNSLTPETTPAGAMCVTGTDLGVKKSKKSGKTCIFTILVYPEGDIQPVCVESGKWGANEIMRRVVGQQRRYGSVVNVEDNGAQDFLIQIMQEDEDYADAGVHIHAFNTGSNKTHPVYGVEGIFAAFARQGWILPSVEGASPNAPPVAATAELAEFLGQCVDYTPGAHTGDSLMAAWIATEGARKPGVVKVGARVIGAEARAAQAPAAKAAEAAAKAERLDGWEALVKRKR